MYIAFDLQVPYSVHLARLQEDIASWANRYGVRYTTKVHKLRLRLGLNRDQDFTTFTMTWTGDPYELVNVANERY